MGISQFLEQLVIHGRQARISNKLHVGLDFPEGDLGILL